MTVPLVLLSQKQGMSNWGASGPKRYGDQPLPSSNALNSVREGLTNLLMS